MNMKVIIVEDEPRVRKGLSESINWNLFGLDLAGTASNGLEGLELFKEQEPELVIADIRMPVMDGLAMTEAILEIKPHTKVIIISGHDEFEYAQRCIALGVTNYLLKPIGKKQFQIELEKINSEWKIIEQKREQTLQFDKKLKSNLPILKNAFLEGWLGGLSVKSTELLHESCSFLSIPLDFETEGALAIFELDLEKNSRYSHSDQRLMEFAMNNMIEELIMNVGFAYQRGNGQSVAIYQSISSDTAKDLVVWVEKTKAKISEILQLSITVAIGPKAVSIDKLPQAFQDAERILRLKLSLGTDLILHEGMVRPLEEQLAVLQESDQVQLIHSIEINDEQEIANVIHHIFVKWQQKAALSYPDEVSFQFAGLFTSLAHRLGKSVNHFLDYNSMERWRYPEKFKSMDEMEVWWTTRFIELSKGYAGFRTDRKTKIIQQVMEYIETHIYDNITREDAAQSVFINGSYLSRMFKEVNGESFSEFVMRKKMDKAIHLLQVERVMVYEVSNRLGYKDPSYFARVFKKFTGKSPSEFQ